MSEIKVIINTDEFSTEKILNLYVEEFENTEILNLKTYNEILENVRKTNKNTILLIDLSNNTVDKLNLLTTVSKEYKNCKTIVFSDNPDLNLIIEAMRAGAKDFIPIPIIKSEFTNSFKKHINFNTTDNNKKCKIISIFSNKGGLGKTSLATNLALSLAKITNENTALIDLNFQTGDITTFLDLKPSFNISYMLENMNKINETFLLSTLERYHKSSLYVLADPPYFKQADNITPKQITTLFNTLKNTFSYIIVDMDAGFDGKNIAALDNSDLILLLTVANLPVLRNTQRCLELFKKLGYDKNKTQIIVNRYMENDEIKENDIKKVLSKEIYWKIPNNYFAIMSAINKGIPTIEQNSSTNIAQCYNELAKHISDNIYKKDIENQFDNILNL